MKLDDLSKLEHSSRPRAASIPDDTEVAAIVKVRVPHYVPEGVTVRSRIDDTMFTVSCRADRLLELEQDLRVESVALAQRRSNVD